MLTLLETEIALKKIKDNFEKELALSLDLTRVSAPLFVDPSTGLNDNLNGFERPVAFDVKGLKGLECEIVHSLAKWKRYALKKYGFEVGKGLYTDMNAIRRDEDLDEIHSIYVDQWDWERVVAKQDRNESTLKETVNKIFQVLKKIERIVFVDYPHLEMILPDEISFITTQELENKYPDLTPKERENAYLKEVKAAFIMKIGGVLASGEKHDGRAPDYDDWSLNGDIMLWNPVLDSAFEISSMGIRVDEESLVKQCELENAEDRLTLDFHQQILNKQLPYTIGGGIGQSRLCMFFLKKKHIGEVQVSLWPESMLEEFNLL